METLSRSYHIDNDTSVADSNRRLTGWYSARNRTYRSVAFGTWQVGAARHLLISQSQSDFVLSSAEADERRLLTTKSIEPNPDTIQPPPDDSTILPSKRRWRTCSSSHDSGISARSQDTTVGDVSDCFLATDYCRYQGDPNAIRPADDSGSLASSSTTTTTTANNDIDIRSILNNFDQIRQYATIGAYRAPSTTRNNGNTRPSPSLFGHQRSHSAGSATVFAVIQCPSGGQQQSQPQPVITTGAFRSTKKFLKKLYNQSSSSNGAKRKLKTPPSTPTDGNSPTISSSSTRTLLATNPAVPVTPPTIDKSIISRDSNTIDRRDFRSWNDVFDYLRQEIQLIQTKDAAILRDFRDLEDQLSQVRNRSSQAESMPI